ATVTWQTSEPATSEVDYGLTTKYILNVTDNKLTTNHSVTLNPKDLLPNTTYHFVVKSVDGEGNLAFSKDFSFKTQPASSKTSLSFWAVIAALIVVGGAAVAARSYLKRMFNKPPGGSPTGGNNSGSDDMINPGGPDTSSSSMTVNPEPTVIMAGGEVTTETPSPADQKAAQVIKPSGASAK